MRLRAEDRDEIHGIPTVTPACAIRQSIADGVAGDMIEQAIHRAQAGEHIGRETVARLRVALSDRNAAAVSDWEAAMPERRPGDKAHLERLIDRWSKDDEAAQATAGRLRRLVSISALATMLDGLDREGEVRLALKSGASLELRFGPTARALRDVDALVNIDVDDAFAEIAHRLPPETVARQARRRGGS